MATTSAPGRVVVQGASNGLAVLCFFIMLVISIGLAIGAPGAGWHALFAAISVLLGFLTYRLAVAGVVVTPGCVRVRNLYREKVIDAWAITSLDVVAARSLGGGHTVRVWWRDGSASRSLRANGTSAVSYAGAQKLVTQLGDGIDRVGRTSPPSPSALPAA